MYAFSELFKSGWGSATLADIAKRLNLPDSDLHRAIDALAPAFAFGLKRTAENTEALAQVMQTIAADPESFIRPDTAFTPEGFERGNRLLATLFGDANVSRAVARHVSETTDMATETLERLLPVLATLFFGSVSRASPTAKNAAENPFLRAWSSALKGSAGTAETGSGNRADGVAGASFPPNPFAPFFNLDAQGAGAAVNAMFLDMANHIQQNLNVGTANLEAWKRIFDPNAASD